MEATKRWGFATENEWVRNGLLWEEAWREWAKGLVDDRLCGPPVYITDSNVVERMALIEGKEWAREQVKETGYSVASFLKEFVEHKEYYGENDVLRVEGNPAIYGNGGWNRYLVSAKDGEVALSRSHSREEMVKKAERIGFKIW